MTQQNQYVTARQEVRSQRVFAPLTACVREDYNFDIRSSLERSG